MGLLDRFEKGVERAVNGVFARTFRSRVQPVEIASALRRELDDRAAVLGRDRTLVPNHFTVTLSADDHGAMRWGAGISSQKTSGRSEARRIDSTAARNSAGPAAAALPGWVS